MLNLLYWNLIARRKVRLLLQKKIPKDLVIEEISFFTANRVYKNVYRIYVQLAHKTKGFDVEKDYWDWRTNGNILIDLDTFKTNFPQCLNQNRLLQTP